MDVLTDVLRTVRLQNKCYGRFELTAPWGIEVEVSDPRSSHFYVVSCGSGWLDVDGSSQPVILLRWCQKLQLDPLHC